MSLERLGAALADRYTAEHELGQGGTATVYLAQDLMHDRSVEIKTTAALSHPHILPLLDSGEGTSAMMAAAGKRRFASPKHRKLWTGPCPRCPVEQEDGDVHVAVIGADKVVRTAAERQRVLAESKHAESRCWVETAT